MGLDLSPVYLEYVWMADVSDGTEVFLAEEAGEVLMTLPSHQKSSICRCLLTPDEPLTTINSGMICF